MIETHIHLTDDQYKDDLNEVIQRSKDNGIKKVILICCDYDSIEKGQKLVAEDKDNYLYMMIGIHPMDVRDIREDYIPFLENILLNNDRVIGIGEIGLDYHWYPEEEKEQKEIFKEQLKLAQKHNVPYAIHAREAYEDTYEIIKEIGYYNGVMHSFADPYQSAKRFLDEGMYIGISGPVTFKNGDNQKEVIKNMPLDKLVIETDGPYLSPVPYRGKRNESIYLKEICECIADLRGITLEEVQQQTTENAKRLFKELR